MAGKAQRRAGPDQGVHRLRERRAGRRDAEVKDGVLAVEPYEYFDRDAIFICSAETLFKLADGKIDPILAFTTGKLKVEGNIDKALRLKQIIDSKKA